MFLKKKGGWGRWWRGGWLWERGKKKSGNQDHVERPKRAISLPFSARSLVWHTSHVLRVLSSWAFSLGSAASNLSRNIIRPKENSLWDTRVFMMQMHLEISVFLGYKKSIEKSKCCYCSSLTSNTYIQNSDPIWIQWTGDLEEGKWMKLVLALELWQGGTADLPDKSQGCEWFSIHFHFIFLLT